MPKHINKEYGINFADVCVSLNQALNGAGGMSRSLEQMLATPMVNLFHDMACNNIRFSYQAPAVEKDENPEL